MGFGGVLAARRAGNPGRRPGNPGPGGAGNGAYPVLFLFPFVSALSTSFLTFFKVPGPRRSRILFEGAKTKNKKRTHPPKRGQKP